MEDVFDNEDEFPLAVGLFQVMKLSSLSIRHCLMKNPGECWFEIFSMTVTYQIRVGSSFWPIFGYLVLGWRS